MPFHRLRCCPTCHLGHIEAVGPASPSFNHLIEEGDIVVCVLLRASLLALVEGHVTRSHTRGSVTTPDNRPRAKHVSKSTCDSVLRDIEGDNDLLERVVVRQVGQLRVVGYEEARAAHTLDQIPHLYTITIRHGDQCNLFSCLSEARHKVHTVASAMAMPS